MHKKTAVNNTKMYIVSLKKSEGYGILLCAYWAGYQPQFLEAALKTVIFSKMRQCCAVCLVAVSFLLLAGCTNGNQELEDKTVVTIEKDGSVKAKLVESFAESYYSQEELIQMVNDELADYNSKHGEGSIIMDGYELADGLMHIDFSFADVTAYNDYMDDDIFVGTVSEAYSAGYDFNRMLSKASASENTIGKNDLMGMGDKKIVVLEGDAIIKTPSKIKYYSQGMLKGNATTVSAVGDGIYFVVY